MTVVRQPYPAFFQRVILIRGRRFKPVIPSVQITNRANPLVLELTVPAQNGSLLLSATPSNNSTKRKASEPYGWQFTHFTPPGNRTGKHKMGNRDRSLARPLCGFLSLCEKMRCSHEAIRLKRDTRFDSRYIVGQSVQVSCRVPIAAGLPHVTKLRFASNSNYRRRHVPLHDGLVACCSRAILAIVAWSTSRRDFDGKRAARVMARGRTRIIMASRRFG